MKTMKKTSILAMLVFGLMSCNSGTESLEFEEANLTSKQSKSLELSVNHRLAGDPDLVHLGVAGDFTILSKSGVTNVPPSVITGNVGTSPITGAALLLTCDEVIGGGKIYTVDAAGPSCKETDAPRLTTAVLDMQAAYTDAASRPVSSDAHLNVGAGNIGGETLVPGVYKWTSTLLIPEDITLVGGPNDVWIFQVAGTLTMSNGKKMILSGDAKAKNIFWQVSGAVTLGTSSHFEGTLLGATSIAVQTDAIVNGRLLAQTAVTLQMNEVTIPAASTPVAIGDLREGGVVFYIAPDDTTDLDGDGIYDKGLVCALSDYPSAGSGWGCVGTSLSNVLYNGGNPSGLGAEIGDGMSNTNAILIECPTAPAASAARLSGAEWFLPSIKELDLMYENRVAINTTATNNGGVAFKENGYSWYWSSTQFDGYSAWSQTFLVFSQVAYNKVIAYDVRAVRAF
jgi:hypothetical protein